MTQLMIIINDILENIYESFIYLDYLGHIYIYMWIFCIDNYSMQRCLESKWMTQRWLRAASGMGSVETEVAGCSMILRNVRWTCGDTWRYVEIRGDIWWGRIFLGNEVVLSHCHIVTLARTLGARGFQFSNGRILIGFHVAQCHKTPVTSDDQPRLGMD